MKAPSAARPKEHPAGTPGWVSAAGRAGVLREKKLLPLEQKYSGSEGRAAEGCVCLLNLKGNEGVYYLPRKFFTPGKFSHFKEESQADDIAAKFFHQLHGRAGCAAGREHVVNDGDALALTYRVFVYFHKPFA